MKYLDNGGSMIAWPNANFLSHHLSPEPTTPA